MAIRGGNNTAGKGWEGPYNLFTSVATATATANVTQDQVVCRGARAVYFVVYDKTWASTATLAANTAPRAVVQAGGTEASALNIGAGVSMSLPNAGMSLQNGVVLLVLPYGSSATAPTSFPARIATHAVGLDLRTSAGVAPANLACDAYVQWD